MFAGGDPLRPAQLRDGDAEGVLPGRHRAGRAAGDQLFSIQTGLVVPKADDIFYCEVVFVSVLRGHIIRVYKIYKNS